MTMTTAMPSQLAICCGPTVITWDCRIDARGDNTTTIRPHGDKTSVAGVAWNHNGQVLASCSAIQGNDEDSNVVLTSMVSHSHLESFRHDRGLKRPSSLSSSHAQEHAAAAAATCVSFGGKSRYLTVGDTSGAVCLWDLKKKTRVRHYFHSGTSCLQAALDPTDTHVLSLTQNALHMFRLREGTLAARLSDTSCHYTHFSASSVVETSKVAIGTKTGAVHVWDLLSQSKVGTLSPHTGAIVGVAFSSVNKLLLASASVDQTLVFSDTASGKTIQRMELESPASCLTFHDDGLTCAVGTESKCVLVYDLRQPNDAMARYQANDVIQSISFAPGSSITAAAGTTGRTKSKSRQATLSPEKKPMTNNAEQKDEQLGPVVESVLNRSRDSMGTTFMAERRSANNEPCHKVAISASLDKSAVREMIQEEMEAMRDEMEEAMRNLHVDMLRQFQAQSQEYSDLISKLQQENEKLRQENEFLKQASRR